MAYANAVPPVIVPLNSQSLSKFDGTVNDSDKSWTVACDTIIEWVHVKLVTTSTVGNRTVQVDVLDSSSNVLYSINAGLAQAASLTRDYHFAPALPTNASFVGYNSDQNHQPIPTNLMVPSGGSLRVYDAAAIAAAADDMTVSFQYQGRLA